MNTFGLRLLMVTLYFSACSCTAFGKPANDEKKKDDKPAAAESKDDGRKRVRTDVLEGVDYAQFKIQRIAETIIKKHQDAANVELKTEAAPWRDKIRAFEDKYGVKLYDENWNRCCDDYDSLTGDVIKGAYKPPQTQPRR